MQEKRSVRHLHYFPPLSTCSLGLLTPAVTGGAGCCCVAPTPVTPTTRPFNQPFSLLRPSHSRSSSVTRISSSLDFFSNVASRSFFFSRKRADAAVFRRRLSSAAVSKGAGAGVGSASFAESFVSVVEDRRTRGRLAAGVSGLCSAE